MKEKNLAVEMLKKLITEKISIYRKTNVVKSVQFSELMQEALNRYVNGLITNAEVIEVSSTAEGAKIVSECENISCAAIASVACAKVYNLNILAEKIQINDNNKTRFYVLSKNKPSILPSDRLAFIAIGSAKDLPNLMSKMEEQKMELLAIHDRPLKTLLGQYYYLIECSNSSYLKYKKLTNNSHFKFRYLGSFNVR